MEAPSLPLSWPHSAITSPFTCRRENSEGSWLEVPPSTLFTFRIRARDFVVVPARLSGFGALPRTFSTTSFPSTTGLLLQVSLLLENVNSAQWWKSLPLGNAELQVQHLQIGCEVLRQLSAGWKTISRHRAFQNGGSLLRIKSRDNVGIASAVGQPPDKPGRGDSFCGLVVNFYSLKAKKIPAGSWC